MLHFVLTKVLQKSPRYVHLVGLTGFALVGSYYLIKRQTVRSASAHGEPEQMDDRACEENRASQNRSSESNGPRIRVVNASSEIQLGFLRRCVLFIL
jgi:hypothetical protein